VDREERVDIGQRFLSRQADVLKNSANGCLRCTGVLLQHSPLLVGIAFPRPCITTAAKLNIGRTNYAVSSADSFGCAGSTEVARLRWLTKAAPDWSPCVIFTCDIRPICLFCSERRGIPNPPERTLSGARLSSRTTQTR
jgi:hypothetical protein